MLHVICCNHLQLLCQGRSPPWLRTVAPSYIVQSLNGESPPHRVVHLYPMRWGNWDNATVPPKYFSSARDADNTIFTQAKLATNSDHPESFKTSCATNTFHSTIPSQPKQLFQHSQHAQNHIAFIPMVHKIPSKILIEWTKSILLFV